MKLSRLFIFIGLLFSFGCGFFIAQNTNVPPEKISALREESDRYSFIKPLLACLEDENNEYEYLKPLKNELISHINTSKDQNKIISSSIYFRDLIEGKWTGVSEDEIYSPASLLKMPVMIAYLKEAETKPELLNKTFTYTKTTSYENPLVTDPLLKNGRIYTAEELIEGMIVDSDNDAKDILVNALDKKILGETYSRLHIENPYSGQENEYRISTKTYGLFLRTLYNATVLNRDMSEKALQILARSKFGKGLRAGIEASVPIAHKYGVKVSRENDKNLTIELSDCGIVYNKEAPFLLCVMTKGTDPYVLSDFIADTARIVEKNWY